MSLRAPFCAFIAQQISQGRYGSTSEVVRAGLRQLEAHETQLATLRAALEYGENSGAGTTFDVDGFLKAKRQKTAGATGKTVAAK